MRRLTANLKCGFPCILTAMRIFLASSLAVRQGMTVPGLTSWMVKRLVKATSKRLARSSSIGSLAKVTKATSPWTF